MFLEDRQLYKHEVSSEAILQVLKLIILNNMVCLSISNGGVVTYVYLVNAIHGYQLNDFMFLKHMSLSIDVFLKLCLLVIKKINVKYSKSFWRISKETVLK